MIKPANCFQFCFIFLELQSLIFIRILLTCYSIENSEVFLYYLVLFKDDLHLNSFMNIFTEECSSVKIITNC